MREPFGRPCALLLAVCFLAQTSLVPVWADEPAAAPSGEAAPAEAEASSADAQAVPEPQEIVPPPTVSVVSESAAAPAPEAPAPEAPAADAAAAPEMMDNAAVEAATMVPLPGKEGDALPEVSAENTVSLDLRNIDVVDALKFLSMKAKLNIITTKNVSGRVTLMVENVPIMDIFDIMLRSNGLAYAKEGSIYNVMTEDEYKAIFGRKFGDVRKVRIMRLKYAIPEQAFSMLDALKSDVGRILVEPDSGTAMVMDTPDRIADIENAINGLEEKNQVRVFELKYAKAKELEEQLKAQVDLKKVGTIKADERSNTLIVQTLPNRMKDVERLILALDVKTREVLIDTKIIKVKLIDELAQGIEWEGLASVGKELGMMYLGSTPFGVIQTATTAAATALTTRNQYLQANAPAGVANNIGAYQNTGNANTNIGGNKVKPGEAMHVGLISQKRDIDVLVKYLQTLGNTQVLAAPKLAVINNHEARIHVGERQAYVTSTTTTGQATSTVSEEVTFVDVGIQLAITPTINEDGFVTMKVKPEISSVVDTLVTNQGNSIPIIDTSMAETTVMVKDGQTIIIGGLRKEEKTNASDQVPFLGNIPGIGFFFKSSQKKTERTELLIMMTPHIVSGEKLTTGEERGFRTKPSKDYKDYKGLADGGEREPLEAVAEDKIKPYADYYILDAADKSASPTIKGVRR